MNELLDKACVAIQEKYKAEYSEFRDEVTLWLLVDQNIEALTDLRDQQKFDTLLDITAVDYWPQETPRFHLLYRLYSMDNHLRILLRMPIHGNAPSVRSVEGVYKNANWYERELWDLMGIHFEGHSDLRRIMMPDDWQGHPLRKDYPLGYEEVEFTFNIDDIQVRKNVPSK